MTVMPGWQFGSDNCSGMCPEAWEALARANAGSAASYGEDAWTARAAKLVRELFEHDCEIFFVFNGTAANALGIAALARSYHAVILHPHAHAEADECGAPEFFSGGAKLRLAGGTHGKLDSEVVDAMAGEGRSLHFPKATVLSLTQATEAGTVYSVRELDKLHAVARRHKMRVHMDGARLANAVATLGVKPAHLTWKRGVEVLSLGGVKNGLAVGEMVVFFNRKLADEFEYRCKQAGQLSSKMRFLAAPWVGLLESGAWLRNAAHANACARRLAAGLRRLPGVRVLQPVEADAVFVTIPPRIRQRLCKRGWRFHAFPGLGADRLMCSWATTNEEIQAFLADARNVKRRN
jgi:threonine aldolase